MQLTRDTITASALRILAEYGLADVSMRRVATSLGVAPGALYWHIENKQELISCLAAEIVRPVAADAAGEATAPEQLARALREAVLGIRDGAEVVLAAMSQPGARIRGELSTIFEEAVREVANEGAPASVLRSAAAGLVTMTLGAATMYQSGAQLAEATGERPVVGAEEATREHEEGIALLMAGLRAGGTAGEAGA